MHLSLLTEWSSSKSYYHLFTMSSLRTFLTSSFLLTEPRLICILLYLSLRNAGFFTCTISTQDSIELHHRLQPRASMSSFPARSHTISDVNACIRHE